MSELSIALLGNFDVQRDGRRLNFESDNGRALLAYLALNSRQAQRRSFLAAMFWPDHTEEAARNNLRQALFKLRQALGEGRKAPFLLISAQSIQFNPQAETTLDVDNLRARLSTANPAALEIYTAPLLSQAALKTSAPFDEWLTLERQQLHQAVTGLCGRLIAAALRAGEWRKAERLAARQLELDAWDENAHRALMQALAAQGQRAAALAAFEKCRRTLWDELGLAPMPETLTLAEQIQQDEGRAAPTGATETGAQQSAHNLPAEAMPFIGRQDLLGRGAELLANSDCRLLTLTGMGGIGKTRLALQLARTLYPGYADGAWLVSMAGLQPESSPQQIDAAIVEALPFSPSGPASLQRQLANYLHSRRALLLLDNAEQLRHLPAHLSQHLSNAPQVKWLVTSRGPLNIPGEWLQPVPPLAYPRADFDNAGQMDAVRLFFQHARMARPSFPLSSLDKAFAARICGLLQGHPLAIELAAAWVNTLSCREILAEIKNNLSILSDQTGSRPARHASIEHVLAQTWQRLANDEQSALGGLAVFRGSFSREAARQVAGAELLELKRLVDYSMLEMEQTADNTPRYRLHEIIRAFAEKQLAPAERTTARRRHADYFAALVGECRPTLGSAQFMDTIARLEIEQDNLTSAWDWAIETHNCTFFEGCSTVWAAWMSASGRFAEGIERFEAALQACPYMPTLYQVQNRLAMLHNFMEGASAPDVAMDYAQRAFDDAQAHDDADEMAYARLQQAIALRRQSRFTQAWEMLEDGLALAGKDAGNWLTASLAGQLSMIAPNVGKLEQGVDYGHLALRLSQKSGGHTSLWSANYALALLAWHQGKLEQAADYMADAIASFGDWPFVYQRANAWQMQGYIHYTRKDYPAALQAFCEAEKFNQTLGDDNLASTILGMKGNIALKQGHWVAAAREAGAAEDLARKTHNDWRLAQILMTLALAHHHLGADKRSRNCLAEMLAILDRLEDPALRALGLLTAIEWLARRGNDETANQAAAHLYAHYSLTSDQHNEAADLCQKFNLAPAANAPDWARLMSLFEAYML